jgi:hypothetical protein
VVHSGSTWMDPSPVVATMYKGLYLSQSVPPTDDWAEFWCPQKRFGHDFFLPCLLLSYYWLMRVWFATREKQPIANPTVKLLFQHGGCCFEVVGTPQVIVGVLFIHWLCVRHCTEWVLYHLVSDSRGVGFTFVQKIPAHFCKQPSISCVVPKAVT